MIRALVALAVLGAAAQAATAAELRVGPGGSIKDAVRAARPGDVIRLEAGTYREHVVLDRPVALVGAGRPVIDGGGTGDVVTVKAPGCRLAGLRITGSGAESLGDTAGVKVLAHRTVVEDCEVDGSLYGFYVSFSDDNRFKGNRITGITRLPRESRGDAIRLHASNRNRLEGNTIQEARDGIYFNGSSGNSVSGNDLADLRYGLHYMSSDDNRFDHNRFVRTDAGAALMFSRNITLSHNLFTGNRGYRAYGLLVKDCEDSVITENAIADNRTGLFLDGAINNRIERNWITANDLGIEVRSSSEGNRLEANVVTGNTSEVALPTGADFNTWHGNYWGGYQGYDLNGDGVGDTPHQAGDLFSYMVETMPPARLFLLGPAIQALSFAERTFPVLDAPQVKDDAPAMRLAVPEGMPALPAAPGRRGEMAVAAVLLLVLGLLPVWLARRPFSP